MSFGFLFFCWNNTQQSKPSEAIRGSLDGLLTGTLSSLLPSCLHFFGRGYSTQRFLESQTKRYEYECMHFFPLLYTAFFWYRYCTQKILTYCTTLSQSLLTPEGSHYLQHCQHLKYQSLFSRSCAKVSQMYICVRVFFTGWKMEWSWIETLQVQSTG